MGAPLPLASPLEEQIGVVDAVTQFERLAALDQIWTGYLADARPPLPEADVQSLERLAAGMLDILYRASDLARYLDDIVERRQFALAEGYEQILADRLLDESGKTLLGDAVERHGGIVNYVRTGTHTIMNTAGAEIDALTTKIDRIRNGGFVAGDLSHEFLCGIAELSIGSGILALASPPPTAGIAILLGAAILFQQHMSGQDC